MSNPAFAAIILAAGEGTRLNSATPKVLHEMAGWPLIRHVTEALRPLAPAETVVVIGQGMEAVARAECSPPDPSPYGRFVCDPDGTLARIVEARDATPEERRIGLCNGGIMAVDARQLFALVDKIGNDNAKREFYLTDIVGIALAQGLLCRAVELPAEELAGVNTRPELAEAEAILQQRLRRRAME